MANTGSINIESYKLPVIDTQEARRNFDGYQVEQYFTLDEIRQGDGPGTTETDSVSDSKGSGGYTSINQKRGPRDKWPTKRS